jgi:4-alpha-glucanotransferase
MDYYDAKWGVGEFKKKMMYFGCEMHNVNGTIDITPYADTYFSFEREATKFGPYSASITNPLRFDVSVINSGAKVPFKIYGANFIREIDISSIAAGLQVFSTVNSYSSEVGPTITKVNIGVSISSETET